MPYTHRGGRSGKSLSRKRRRAELRGVWHFNLWGERFPVFGRMTRKGRRRKGRR